MEENSMAKNTPDAPWNQQDCPDNWKIYCIERDMPCECEEVKKLKEVSNESVK